MYHSRTMSAKTVNKIVSNEDLRQQFGKFLKDGIREEAKTALQVEIKFWKGIEWFISWFRETSENVFLQQINGIVSRPNWRYGDEIFSTVIGTFFGFLKAVFSSCELWEKAHEAATAAWYENQHNGLMAQNYGKTMAIYFLEIITRCFQRAIKADITKFSDEDKKEIDKVLKSLLAVDGLTV